MAESAKQEKKNLMDDMPVDKRASVSMKQPMKASKSMARASKSMVQASKSMLNLKSKYSMGASMRGPLDKISNPLKGNAFIKAKVDAEARGDKSFEVGGKTYPIQMKGDSPMEASYSKGPKMPTPLNGYASDAQRKAVHASKADGGKGNPNSMKQPMKARMIGNAKKSLKSSAMEGASESLPNKKDVYYSNDAGKALPPKFENLKPLNPKPLKELPDKKSQAPTMKVPLMMPEDFKKNRLKKKINRLSDKHKGLYESVVEGYGQNEYTSGNYDKDYKTLGRVEDKLERKEKKYMKKFGGSPYGMGHKK